jgi:hypothetical protein
MKGGLLGFALLRERSAFGNANFISEEKGNVGFRHLNPTYRSAIALFQ